MLPFALVLMGAASAGDHANLEDGLPLEVLDAQPIPYLGREVQGLGRYVRTDDGDDRFLFEPRFEFGIARNAQISVSSPLLVGEGVDDGLGDLRLEGLYNFNRETLVIPALAFNGSVIAPTGEDSEGVDPTLQLVASKTLPGTWNLHQLHLNAAWTFNVDPRADERDGVYKLLLGYSGRVTNNLFVLADLHREQDLEEDREQNLVGVGARYQLNPWSVLSVGSGFGFADESPQLRPAVGFQAAI